MNTKELIKQTIPYLDFSKVDLVEGEMMGSEHMFWEYRGEEGNCTGDFAHIVRDDGTIVYCHDLWGEGEETVAIVYAS